MRQNNHRSKNMVNNYQRLKKEGLKALKTAERGGFGD